ncbi:O-antigen ligase family protein [Flavisolibacter nicotianae]|uniref:O-antigen ligase family protein n=1 Tax=Flavisolibacter nicotianae TaxID=2364882 RepID=UPI000EAF3527|nr:O-antigen ligase family protein [Flavisolibacter nicotianae]
MTTTSHRILVLAGAAFLLACIFAAAYFTLPALCFLPFTAVALLLLVQYPQALFYALLFSIPWSTEFTVSGSLGTDLPDEPLMLLMAFAVVVMHLFRRREEQPKQGLPLPLFLLYAGLAWTVITVALSSHVLLSVKYLLAKGWYILAFVGAPLLLREKEKFLQRSAGVLFISMFLVTCIALARHAALGFTFAKINDALAPFFRNHVNYSALLVFMVPIGLAFHQLETKKWRRVAWRIALVIIFAALLLSYARGAWLALAVGLPAYWLLKKGWLLKAFVLAWLLVAAAVFWLQANDNYLLFAPKHDTTIFHKDFSEHLVATYKGKDVSTAERFYRWVAGARMGRERWLTGFGPTTFYQHYQSYAVPAFRTWVSTNREQSTVHNYFLLLLIEQGLAGLLFFVLLIGVLLWQAQRIYRRTTDPLWKTTVAAIAAILLMQCTVNFLSDLVETDKVGSVFYLCLAFLVIADAKTREPQKIEE